MVNRSPGNTRRIAGIVRCRLYVVDCRYRVLLGTHAWGDVVGQKLGVFLFEFYTKQWPEDFQLPFPLVLDGGSIGWGGRSGWGCAIFRRYVHTVSLAILSIIGILVTDLKLKFASKRKF